jgi:hypothetical protein
VLVSRLLKTRTQLQRISKSVVQVSPLGRQVHPHKRGDRSIAAIAAAGRKFRKSAVSSTSQKNKRNGADALTNVIDMNTWRA